MKFYACKCTWRTPTQRLTAQDEKPKHRWWACHQHRAHIWAMRSSMSCPLLFQKEWQTFQVSFWPHTKQEPAGTQGPASMFLAQPWTSSMVSVSHLGCSAANSPHASPLPTFSSSQPLPGWTTHSKHSLEPTTKLSCSALQSLVPWS